MCLVHVRPVPDEEEITVASRPVRRRFEEDTTTFIETPRSRPPRMQTSRPASHHSLHAPGPVVPIIKSPSHGVSPVGSPRTSFRHPSASQLQVEPIIVEQYSPRSSVVSSRSREYVIRDSVRDRQPLDTFRWVDSRPTVKHGQEGDRLSSQEPRRSGNVIYVNNPMRTSTTSHRSTRERVVILDDDGRRREYYR